MTVTVNGTTGVSLIQDGVVVQADIASPLYLPSPQTWQDVLVSPGRAIGVVYTNNTGQPIKVAISGGGVAGAAVAQIRWATNSVIRGYQQASTFNGTTYTAMTWQLYFEVPNGSTYTIDNHAGTNTLFTWMELR